MRPCFYTMIGYNFISRIIVNFKMCCKVINQSVLSKWVFLSTMSQFSTRNEILIKDVKHRFMFMTQWRASIRVLCDQGMPLKEIFFTIRPLLLPVRLYYCRKIGVIEMCMVWWMNGHRFTIEDTKDNYKTNWVKIVCVGLSMCKEGRKGLSYKGGKFKI